MVAPLRIHQAGMVDVAPCGWRVLLLVGLLAIHFLTSLGVFQALVAENIQR